MAGGAFVDAGEVKHYGGKVTGFVLVSCVVAAMGGLLFGYDLGVSGGVTSMDVFLEKFFPSVHRKSMSSKDTNQYCKFDSQLLTLFTSSLYLAALVASFFASAVTRAYGRKISMLIGALTFLVGSIINGFAVNVEMLIIGRLLLGVGVGFGNQSVPVYLSEMAPARIRGGLNMGFQLAITIGILVANFVNYGTSKIKGGYGWRISVGLAAVPAILMTIGSLCLPDTPNSLIERGQNDKAKAMLEKIRGTTEVDEEFQDLVEASEEARGVGNAWGDIRKRKYRPHLTFCILIPFFQQLTGINVIMFYAPVLFKTLGFGDDASLMSAAITGVVNMVSTFVSIATVDKYGRRILFLEGGAQMLICQVAIGAILGAKFGLSGTGTITKSYADLLLALICFYVAAFAWSWGPLGWLVPSEILPLEIRPAGQATNVIVNMLMTFAVGQLFLTALCHLKFGLFFFFAAWVAVMTTFIYFFLPETKNVPIEEMKFVWKKHWFWGQFIVDDHTTPGGVQMQSQKVVEA